MHLFKTTYVKSIIKLQMVCQKKASSNTRDSFNGVLLVSTQETVADRHVRRPARFVQRVKPQRILSGLSPQPQGCIVKSEVHNYNPEALSNPVESQQQQKKIFWDI